MDENVLFNKNSSQQPSSPAPSGPVGAENPSPVETTQPPLTDPTGTIPVIEDSQTPPPPTTPVDTDPPGLPSGLIKKVLIGVGILIVLIVVVILLLPKSQQSQNVKLQWWGLWEEKNAVQSLIADFEKTHPNIDVEYLKKDPKDYRDRLETRIENDTGPDIFRYHNTWIPMLSTVLSPLSSDVITPDEFKKAYYPVMQNDLVKNGAIYGIPLGVDSLALYVNPELFESAGVQVPTTWDDFVKAAKKLTVKDTNGKIKTSGAAIGAYDNIAHASDIVSLLFVQQGVDMNTIKAVPKKQADALKFYTSFAGGAENVWDAKLDNSLLMFSRGDLAMYFGYSWDAFTIQRLNKDLTFTTHPVPELYGKKTTIASYWVEGVSAKSPHQKEALEFMHYLAQKETAEKFYTETAKARAFGEPYARRDLKDKLREKPLVYPFVSQLDNASSSIFVSDTHDGDTGINSLANTYLGTSIRSMVNESNSAESATDALNKGLDQLFQKYGIQQQP